MTNILADKQLLTANSNGEFIPYFQPIFESKKNTLIGAEVLMRWQHPINGIISPDFFIPQAEISGAIIAMTRSLIVNTANLLCAHSKSFPKNFHISINIVPQHFDDDQLIEDCIFFYKKCSRNNFTLILELTERGEGYNSDIMARLERLSSNGVKLALDDFGTGHSNLYMLQIHPFDYIKIDKAFVSRIDINPRSRHIVDSMISLANKLSVAVVAEGVENKYQETYLRDSQVDYFQGFFYSPPLSFYDLLKLIKYVSRMQQ